MPMGSMTAPERICAPTSEPFSSTQTLTSLARLRRQLFEPDRRRQARRAPRPRSTTSYSMLSRSTAAASAITDSDVIPVIAL